MMDVLLTIAPPPEVPIATGNEEGWERLGEAFQFWFPPDYREFIGRYGNGRFVDFFGFPSPFYVSSAGRNFEKFVKQRKEGVEFSKTMMPKHAFEFPVHPQAGGLFPFGYADNGGTIFFWIESRHSEKYKIVCARSGYTKDVDIYDMGMVEFVVNWLQQKIEVSSLSAPDLFPYDGPLFSPLNE